jgi:transcriptional regulator with XRE-family HTH domain
VADFGNELRRLLGERGMSLRELARRAHCDPGYLSRMANGRKCVSPQIAAIADKVLGADGSLIRAAEVSIPESMGSRRARVSGKSRAVASSDVEAVLEITATFRQLDNKFGGEHAHKLASDYLNSVVLPMLRAGSYTEATGQKLFTGAAQLAHLVAWTAYDMNNHRRARLYFGKALDLATAAGDQAFAGEVLAARSHQAVHVGEPVRAAELARACRQIAQSTAVPALLAEACQLEANSYALLGDRQACVSRLHEAERAFGSSGPENTPVWLGYLDECYLAARFAHCFRDMGAWNDAQQYAIEALTISASLARTRTFNVAVLATTYVETDPGEACRVGAQALGMAANLQSGRIVRYIDDLLRRLRRCHKDEPVVESFSAQARETLGAI